MWRGGTRCIQASNLIAQQLLHHGEIELAGTLGIVDNKNGSDHFGSTFIGGIANTKTILMRASRHEQLPLLSTDKLANMFSVR